MRRPTAPTVLMIAGLIVCLPWSLVVLPALGLGGYGPGARGALLRAAVAPPALASILLLAAGALRLRRRQLVGPSGGGRVFAGVALALGAAVGLLAAVLYAAGR